MQKIGLEVPYLGNFKKFLLVMKLCIIILFISLVTASAKTSYSQSTKFSLNLENVTVKELFEKIESSSEFIFVYYDDIINLNEEVSVKAENQTVEEVLAEAFKSSGNTFKVFDRQIVIAKKESSTADMEALLAQQPQKKALKGTVTDTKGSPLPGVSVVVKGTTVGITTNVDGSFNLMVPTDSKTLVLSFVGMITQEILIGDKNAFTVMLNESKLALDEVVVTALGIVKSKKSLTYSTQEVNMDGLTTVKDISLGNALAGKIAGVSVTSSTGASGVSGDPRIIIRGDRSINGNNQPLIVVDGIPYSSSGGGLSSINPDDVQSMNILKGPAASALYGSSANNGVIVVTTKKGKSGEPRIVRNVFSES